ncbi:PsiF family protein [Bordetella pseudohinzii]|uniref:Phosphate starvation-inducible protein psiF n=2 Tax=Bordetella pseudohinzii TaxID=1331258 RepID=A0A0J6BXX2_9BORD|nr:PsiF family protein [Bordetella pseudohinzii]ANY17810.1 PsiF repeat family protein [Bordetella pseudohinzii]KMM26554.1 PsiF repeat family protein [Bordetella pseudohinzii]KXA77148.1 PsiF repeat family protein [Bordetella pseudohinzii]KXA77464.1 PsiF repeat family protein [Bordetella pseudohinzii]CUI77164.1 Phosphate starvation-inducible protein psiF precursor [Bordetella pseudohinzii]
MVFRKSSMVAGLCLALLASGPVAAQTAAPAATPSAKQMTPQQERMAACNRSAEGKKGDDRKAYMSSCLRGEAPAKQLTPQQQRMKDCNAKAGAQSLAGDKRKTFMSNCLKGG